MKTFLLAKRPLTAKSFAARGKFSKLQKNLSFVLTAEDMHFAVDSLELQEEREVVRQVCAKLGHDSGRVSLPSGSSARKGDLAFLLQSRPKSRLDEPPRLNFFRLSVLGGLISIAGQAELRVEPGSAGTSRNLFPKHRDMLRGAQILHGH